MARERIIKVGAHRTTIVRMGRQGQARTLPVLEQQRVCSSRHSSTKAQQLQAQNHGDKQVDWPDGSRF